MITSLGIKTIRRSKKIKKAKFSITGVGLKDISKIIKEFEYFLMRVMWGIGPNTCQLIVISI